MKKKGLTSALALTTLVPSLAFAVDFQADGTSIFRLEQRATPGFEKQTVAPFTQFAGVDVDKLADGNLSLHLYGWERVDLGDSSTGEKKNDGELSYGYLRYRFARANGDLKAGRFVVNEGIASEQLDGVAGRTDLAKGFALSAFAGAPVKLDRGSNTKGSFIAGGRGSYAYGSILEVGISGVHEKGGIYEPLTGNKYDRELVGGDFWLRPEKHVELNGRGSYDASTDGMAEQSYQLKLFPLKNVTVSGLYNDADLAHYFSASNLRSLFNPDLGGKVKSYGGAVTWNVAAPVDVTGDFRHIKRSDSIDQNLNGDSNRYGADLRLNFLDKKVRPGVSYHRVEGATGFNSYHEIRGYCMYDNGRYQGSVDGIAQLFKSSLYQVKNAYEAVASAGWRIIPALALSGEVSYSRNPWATDDVRGLVRLTFNYISESKGANK
ncbi:hypothetical protein L4X63_03915 [Geomonas sp. Red32]|uniref:hypothetical protein n=1 Tax=Geomonas sp. Red32 TaxID=2912856 RepID=UPI00202CDB5E|nr:hypothetical protein [Geomonas sp. Red32]MCM0080731.1 hypothetical protein [Geomonas sp. Red32]